jgi:hypothetical protein
MKDVKNRVIMKNYQIKIACSYTDNIFRYIDYVDENWYETKPYQTIGYNTLREVRDVYELLTKKHYCIRSVPQKIVRKKDKIWRSDFKTYKPIVVEIIDGIETEINWICDKGKSPKDMISKTFSVNCTFKL